MKKLLFLLIPVLALLTACQTSIDQIIPSFRPVPKVFYASIEETQADGLDTKVYVDAQMHVLWNADDRISIFNKKDANLQYRFEGEDGDNAGEFTIVGSGASGSDVPHIFAVYPYSAGTAVNAAGVISVTLPDVQVYKANSFGIGANTMVSVTDDIHLRFKNLGGFLSLKLYGDDIDVKSISLRGNNGEKIAGAATVTADVLGAPVTVMSDAATGTITLDCGKGVSLKASEVGYTEFWMVVPPTSFPSGFTITVTDIRGGTYSKSTNKPFEISRNTLSRMAPLEVTPDYTNSKAVFEDANFKAFCVAKFDENKDNEIQMEEALPVKSISVSTDEIESLEGISFFANLEELICRGSEVQIPTKSSEGTMFVGKLKNLDLSHNKKLVRLDCSGNKIENLDLSNNGQLEELNCSDNKIENLDLSNNSQLEELNCSGNNIEILDVSNNQALQVVQCADNPMTTFNVSEGQVIPTVEIPEETSVVCEWVAPEQGNNEIWYTSTDGNIVNPYKADAFNVNITANTYENGRGKIEFDGALVSIGINAFSAFDADNLKTVSLPSTLTTLGSDAFSYNTHLESVHLNEGLLTIGSCAFEGNRSLHSVFIPSSVTRIDGSAFMECSNLQQFTGDYATDDGRWLVINGVACGFAQKGLTQIIIPEGITEIADMLFQWCYDLVSVTLPSTLTAIGDHAFYGCYRLLDISAFPKSLQRIGYGAFTGCQQITAFNGKYATEDGRYLIIGNRLVAVAPNGLEVANIPSKVDTIEIQALESCSGLKTIFVPASVKSIGRHAFQRNANLVSVTIAATEVPAGGVSMFEETNDCPIFVPASSVDAYKAAQYWSTYAGRIQPIAEGQPNNEIWYTSTDGSVVVPNKTDAFGVNIVSNTYEDGLGILEFDGPVQEVGLDAFFRCSKLQTILLPEGLVSVGTFAFEECDNLTSVTFPSTLKSLSQCAFFGCTDLTSINIPDSVTTISSLGVFAGCSSLVSFTGRYASVDGRSLIVDNTLKAIAASGMSAYRVPDNVSTVPSMVIACYPDLKKLVYPATTTTIGQVYNCSGLDSVVFEAATPPSISQGGYFGSEPLRLFLSSDNCLIYVPSTSVEAYKSAAYWSDYADRIRPIDEGQPNNEIWYTSTDGNIVVPNKTNVFGANIVSNTYENGKGIIKFDGDVTVVGGFAFNQCSSLKTITLPQTTTSLGTASFQSCKGLVSISIPDGVTIIGESAFLHCSSLTDVILPSNLRTLKSNAFSNCSSLVSINIPESLEEIDEEGYIDNVFDGCSRLNHFSGKFSSDDGRFLVKNNMLIEFAPSGLTSYTVPEGIKVIGSGAFSDCNKLTSIILPSTLTTIGEYAFMYATSLKSLNIPGNVTSIGCTSFSHCDGLEKFSGRYASDDGRCLIMDNVVVAFAPSGLTSYSIPSGVTGIGAEAFFYCDKLSSVSFPETLTTIGESAFQYCEKLTRLSLPANLKNIEDNAFSNRNPVLDSVMVLATTPPAAGNTIFGSVGTYPIFVPSASVDAYKAAEGWNIYADRIQPIVEIPDANFRAYVFDQYDINKDGILSQAEKDSVKILQLHSSSISSLEGIELFPHLQKLLCSNNNLTSIDVSHNTELISVACSNNQLTKLDLSNNSALIALSCSKNQLTSLDLSNNPKLELIYCYSNLLTEIKLSTDENRVAIGELDCRDNKFTELNVSDHVISTLDVRNNKLMRSLYCLRCQLSALEVEGVTEMAVLNCSDNALTELDLGTNVKLVDLICCDNKLKSLDVTPLTSLDFLHCDNNLLSGLDVSKNSALRVLQCANNSLTALNVDANTNLQTLACGNNQIDSLDVSKNLLLTGFSCSYNLLSSLDVSNHSNLTWLRCENNNLTSIDVSGCTSFARLYCFDNKLTSLDVSTCVNMSELYCHNNSFLTEIWLRTDQSIPTFVYDDQIAVIKRK